MPVRPALKTKNMEYFKILLELSALMFILKDHRPNNLNEKNDSIR
jgi:hypothetical protein